MPKDNYSTILKSSSLIGGAQGITLLIGMVSTKFVAVLIGPLGLGMLSLYKTIQGFASTLAGLGIGSSGVRDIAEAWGSGDAQRIGRMALTLRRMCWLTGIAGALLLAAVAPWASLWTFDSAEHTNAIRLLGVSLLFGNLAAGQSALILGTRRIADMAKLTVIGATMGCLASIGFYSWLGLEGIIPTILSMAVLSWLVTHYFAARIEVPAVSMTWLESIRSAGGLVRLGIALMWTGLLGIVVALITRTLITQEIDLIAVGIYAAAFNLSGQFANFILGAMGADYYPSLTAVQHDHVRMRELVDQQTEIGLLLALPGLIATLTLAPLAIQLFYTAEFAPASPLLQWFVLGCLGRVISWPQGFIILAKGKSALFAGTETFANLLHLGLIFLGLQWFGLIGVAYAFALLHLIFTALIAYVSHRLIAYRWSAKVMRLIAIIGVSALIGFWISRSLSILPASIVGGGFSMLLGLFSLRELSLRLDPGHRVNQMAQRIPLLRQLCSPAKARA